MSVAEITSHLSKDPVTKVGAVIVSPDNRKISIGYNGFAAGLEETSDMWHIRDIKIEQVIHAEMNAIINAPFDIKGCSLYCTHQPCHRCLIHVANSGIIKVVYKNEYTKMGNRDIWIAHSKLFKEIYQLME